MLIKYSKLSDYRLKKLLRCFCEDLTATQTTRITSINRNTVNRYYHLFREKIAAYQESMNRAFKGEVELDESYFGSRNKGRRGRGTAKIPVFGIFRRNGRVYTQIIRNSGRAEIRPIIMRFVRRGSVVYTDKWRAYDGLVFNGYKHIAVLIITGRLIPTRKAVTSTALRISGALPKGDCCGSTASEPKISTCT